MASNSRGANAPSATAVAVEPPTLHEVALHTGGVAQNTIRVPRALMMRTASSPPSFTMDLPEDALLHSVACDALPHGGAPLAFETHRARTTPAVGDGVAVMKRGARLASGQLVALDESGGNATVAVGNDDVRDTRLVTVRNYDALVAHVDGDLRVASGVPRLTLTPPSPSTWSVGNGDAYVTYVTEGFWWRPSFVVRLAASGASDANSNGNNGESQRIASMALVATITNATAFEVDAQRLALVIGRPNPPMGGGGGHSPESRPHRLMMARSTSAVMAAPESSSDGGGGGSIVQAGELQRIVLGRTLIASGTTSRTAAVVEPPRDGAVTALYYCDLSPASSWSTGAADGRLSQRAQAAYGHRIAAASRYLPAGEAIVYDGRGRFAGAARVPETAQGARLDLVLSRSTTVSYAVDASVRSVTTGARREGEAAPAKDGAGDDSAMLVDVTRTQRVDLRVRVTSAASAPVSAVLRYQVGDAAYALTSVEPARMRAAATLVDGYLELPLVVAPGEAASATVHIALDVQQ